jgi:hypothetical protein
LAAGVEDRWTALAAGCEHRWTALAAGRENHWTALAAGRESHWAALAAGRDGRRMRSHRGDGGDNRRQLDETASNRVHKQSKMFEKINTQNGKRHSS